MIKKSKKLFCLCMMILFMAGSIQNVFAFSYNGSEQVSTPPTPHTPSNSGGNGGGGGGGGGGSPSSNPSGDGGGGSGKEAGKTTGNGGGGKTPDSGGGDESGQKTDKTTDNGGNGGNETSTDSEETVDPGKNKEPEKDPGKNNPPAGAQNPPKNDNSDNGTGNETEKELTEEEKRELEEKQQQLKENILETVTELLTGETKEEKQQKEENANLAQTLRDEENAMLQNLEYAKDDVELYPVDTAVAHQNNLNTYTVLTFPAEYLEKILPQLTSEGIETIKQQIAPTPEEQQLYACETQAKKMEESVKNMNTENPVIEQIKAEEQGTKITGDPVDITSGSFICDYSDEFIKRYYRNGDEGKCGTDWVTALDSRIIRCTEYPQDEIYLRGWNALRYYESMRNKILAYKEQYPDDTSFDEELDRIETEICFANGDLEWAQNFANCIIHLTELNKYVNYGARHSRNDLYKGEMFILYIDEYGNENICVSYDGNFVPLYLLENPPYKIVPLNENSCYGKEAPMFCGAQAHFEDGFIVEYKNGTKKTYSSYGILEKIEYSDGRVHIYDSVNGNINHILFENGENIFIDYNADNHITRVYGDCINETVYSYEGKYLKSVVDVDGIWVGYNYDNNGNMISIKKADGTAVSIEYEYKSETENYVVSKVTNEIGDTELFSYDFSDLLNKKINHLCNDGSVEYFNCNEFGKVSNFYDTKGNSKNLTYNDNGLIEEYSENGMTKKYFYNEENLPVLIEYDNGSSESFEYDSLNYMISQKDRDENVYDYSYDDKGNLISVYYNGYLQTDYVYDSKNRITRCFENGIGNYYDYDNYGNVIHKKTDYGNNLTIDENWTYSSKNKLIKYQNSLGDETVIEYGDKKKTEIQNNQIKKEYFYNERGWITEEIQTDLKTGEVLKKRIVYDSSYNVKKFYINDKLCNSYSYNPGGILISETSWAADGTGITTEYVYDLKYRDKSKIMYFVDENGLPYGERQVLYEKTYEDLSDGKLISVRQGTKNPQNYYVDFYGNIVKNSQTDGTVVEYDYSKGGKLRSVKDSFGKIRNVIQNSDGSYDIVETKNNGLSVVSKFNNKSKIIEQNSRNIKTSLQYDSRGNIIEENGQNYKIQNFYDVRNRLTKTLSFDSNGKLCYENHYEYDDENRVVYKYENGKCSCVSRYDVWGRVVEESNGNGICRYEYDGNGNVISCTDGEHNQILYSYDGLGNVVKIQKNGFVREYKYYPNGSVKEIYDNGNLICKYSFDDSNLVTDEIDGFGNVKKYSYDVYGNLIGESNSNGSNKLYSYETLNYNQDEYKKISFINSMAKKIEYVLNCDNQITSVKNADGKIKKYVYDANGRVVEKIGYSGRTVSFVYDDEENSVVKKLGSEESKVIYNPFGAVIFAENNGTSFSYDYDTAGNLICVTDNKSGEKIEYCYDEFSRCIQSKGKNFNIGYIYNDSGFIIKIKDSVSKSFVKIEYDDLMRESKREYSNGSVVSYGYDVMGRRTYSVWKDSFDQIVDCEFVLYDENGRVSYVFDKDGKFKHYTYNSKGHLLKEEFEYTLDVAEFYRKEAEKCGLSDFEKVSDSYVVYLESDVQNRIGELFDCAGVSKTDFSKGQISWVQEYSYSLIGNVISTVNAYGTIDYEYDDLNRLILKHGRGINGGGVKLSWDDDGFLVSLESDMFKMHIENGMEDKPVRICYEDLKSDEIQQIDYCYDAFGRCYYQNVSDFGMTKFVYDGFSFDIIGRENYLTDGGEVYENKTVDADYDVSLEYKLIGSGKKNMVEEAVVNEAGGKVHKKLSSEEKRSCTVLYVNGNPSVNIYVDENESYGRCMELTLCDYKGAVTGIIDSYGELIGKNDYDAYGNLLAITKNCIYNSSMQLDMLAETTYDFCYRKYLPEYKQFISEDPATDGENWFAYCSFDPVNFIDPMGLENLSIISQYHMTIYDSTRIPYTNNHFVSNYGCAITLASNVAYSAGNTTTNPETICKNNKNFTGNGSLIWANPLPDNITTNGRAGNPLTFSKYNELDQKSEQYYIGIQVQYTGSSTNPSSSSHWVGCNGLYTKEDGSQYFIISATSNNDSVMGTSSDGNNRGGLGWENIENVGTVVPVERCTDYILFNVRNNCSK